MPSRTHDLHTSGHVLCGAPTCTASSRGGDVDLVSPARGRRPRRVLRSAGRLVSMGLALAVLGLLAAPPADAHVYLLRSDPASGSSSSVSPTRITLWFDEEISAARSSARVVRADGSVVRDTRLAVPGTVDPRTMRILVPALAVGSYGVLWSAVDEEDGHTTTGTIAFGVGAAAGGDGTAQAAAPGPADVVRRWAGIAGLAGLIGALAMIVLVVGRGTSATRAAVHPLQRRMLRLAACAVVLSIAAAATDLTVALARATPAGAGALEALRLLLDTRWGLLWVLRVVALAVILVVLVVRLRSRATVAGRATSVLLGVVATCAGALVVIEALGSHAAGVGSLAITVDALHILAACLWVGLVPALVLVLWPSVPAEVPRATLIRSLRTPFSRLALGSAAVLVATGLYSAGLQVDTVHALLSTSYGLALVVKSVLLVGLCALGATNAIRLHQMHRLGGRRSLLPSPRPLARRLVVAESLVGALTLVVVAFLVQTAPARDLPTASPLTEHSASGSVDDLSVTVSATPNRPGLNAFTVIAASSRRPAPGTIAGVGLDLGVPGSSRTVALQSVGAGQYFATARWDGGGPEQIVVLVNRAGHQLRVTMSWSSDQPGGSGLDGSRRLAPYVNAAAIAVLAAVGVSVGGYVAWRRRRTALVPSASPEPDRVAETTPP